MIVLGAVSGVLALLYALFWLFSTAMGHEELRYRDDAEQAGYIVGWMSGFVAALLCLVTSPIILYAGIQMSKFRSYGLAKAGAVLSIIPCTTFCCIAGIPIGIWSIVVLGKPEVKTLFDRPQYPQPPYPQPPYQGPPFQQPPPGSY